MKPLAIDLFCGLGGWSDGLLAEGFEVVGFDIERHRYPAREIVDSDGRKVRQEGVHFNSPSSDSKKRSFNYANECAVRDAPLTGGWMEYPAQLVVQDVLTLHGSQFKDAALIVASPPCQEYSYMAMPWTRAKALAADYRSGKRDVADLTRLFDACFRIQREACEAAGRHIPLVVENVRGAIPWVGRSRWNYGSFHLWGDVPALMPPITARAKLKGGDVGWRERGAGRQLQDHFLSVGHPNKRDGHEHTRHLTNPGGHRSDDDGRKIGGDWFSDPTSPCRRHGSKSPARKMASAMIAKIPLPLSRHIARCYHPGEMQEAA